MSIFSLAKEAITNSKIFQNCFVHQISCKGLSVGDSKAFHETFDNKQLLVDLLRREISEAQQQ